MSDGPSYLRRLRLTIVKPRPDPATGVDSFFGLQRTNALEIDASSDEPALRVKAEIKKSLSSTPNPATITIWNLADRTRDELAASPLVVILEVGYGSGELRQLFLGDVFYVSHELDGPNVVTMLQAHDGGRAYAHARINRSYRAGTPVITAVKEAALALGLQVPAAVESHPDLQRAAAAGLVLAGKASDQLSRLLSPFGLGWSIQDGSLTVLSEHGIRPGEAILIDEQAGMIGSPTWGQPSKKGAKPPLTVKTLLFPELAPGKQVTVKSRFANGNFKIKDANHDVDTDAGGDWMTTIECKAAG